MTLRFIRKAALKYAKNRAYIQNIDAYNDARYKQIALFALLNEAQERRFIKNVVAKVNLRIMKDALMGLRSAKKEKQFSNGGFIKQVDDYYVVRVQKLAFRQMYRKQV